MLFGAELVKSLKNEIDSYQKALNDRSQRISDGLTDMEDCFISQRVEERGIQLAKDKISLIEKGGCDWFVEYATLDDVLVRARWCETVYGRSLRVEMSNGEVIWTTANTEKGLKRKGLKKVLCLRPAWFTFKSSMNGLCGVLCGYYTTFPSDINYATGKPASYDPVDIKPYDYED